MFSLEMLVKWELISLLKKTRERLAVSSQKKKKKNPLNIYKIHIKHRNRSVV